MIKNAKAETRTPYNGSSKKMLGLNSLKSVLNTTPSRASILMSNPNMLGDSSMLVGGQESTYSIDGQMHFEPIFERLDSDGYNEQYRQGASNSKLTLALDETIGDDEKRRQSPKNLFERTEEFLRKV